MTRLALQLMQRRCTLVLKRLKRRPAIVVATCGLSSSSMLFANLSSVNLDSSQHNNDPPGRKKSSRDFWDPSRRATDLLLLLNAACFLLQWLSRGALTYWGCKVNSLILDQGQYWRILTPAFLHSSLIHLAVNSYALHTLGPQVEALSGQKRLAIVYLGSALVGTLMSVFFTPQPSLGASGAIFGLGASLGLFYWRHRSELGERSEAMLRQLSITVAVNLAYSIAVKNIDNWGHVGGGLGGLVISYLLGPRLLLVASSLYPDSTLEDVPYKTTNHKRQYIDSPPLKWLAFDSTFSLQPNTNSNPNQARDRKPNDYKSNKKKPNDPPTAA